MSKRFRNSLSLQLAMLVVAVAACDAADITLRRKIVPVKPIVTLGDIADIRATTTAERSQLALTQLWSAPPVGELLYVTAEQVQQVLISRGYSRSQLNFYGASQVAIGWEKTNDQQPTAARQNNITSFRQLATAAPSDRTLADISDREAPIFLSAVQRDQLADQLREATVAYLETQTGKVGRIEVDFNLPARHADLLSQQTSELFVSGGKAPWTGRQRLNLDFDSEQGPIEMPFSVRIYDTTPVLIAQRPVAAGQMLTAADVAIQSPSRETRMPIGKALVYDLEEALGKEASRGLRAGEVVSADLCLPPMMVQRGEVVTIVSSGGGIVIRRRGAAVADARQGQTAEVELLDTKQRIVGRVVGPAEIAVYGGALAPGAARTRRK